MLPWNRPKEGEQEVTKVWTPLPGSQELALNSPADVTVYHGTRGPGKTDTQLMRFRLRVGQGYGSFWRGVIFDREYKNLDDLISKSLRWFNEFGDGARFLRSTADYRWVWPTGEELLFRTLKKESDYWGYHGQEFPFIGWNELTKYPDEKLFEAMMSCNRSSFIPGDYPILQKDGSNLILPEIPLEIFATTNPFGVGHNWVKKRFISPSPAGVMVKQTTNVFNPRTGKREDVTRTQVHIHGSYKENKYLSPQYIAELEKITDVNKRKAWLHGSWDIVAGGMFDDLWSKPHHVVKDFTIPRTWRVDRSFDWGSSHPFSVGWWAESDGSDVQMPDGSWRSTVRGDLFRIMEWYGSTGKTNEGLRMLATDVAAGIIEREITAGLYGRVNPGPADNSIWDVQDGNSIAASMLKATRVNGRNYRGVTWVRCDKSPGSRVAGWEKVRERLANSIPKKGPREKPGLFCFESCLHYQELLPVMPRDEKKPDDVDTEAEDHLADEVRYKILSTNRGGRVGKTKGT